LRAEIQLEFLGEPEAPAERHVLAQVGELPELRVITSLVSEAVAHLSREERGGLEEAVDGRIESVTCPAPSVVSGDDGPVAAREQAGWRRGSGGNVKGLAAGVIVRAGHRPASQHPGAYALRQVLFAFSKWQLINHRKLEIMGDVVLADRFFEAPVELVHGVAASPISVGIGEQLREHVGGLYQESVRGAALVAHDRGMIRRMAAVIAASAIGVDAGVLRERTQRAANGGAASPLVLEIRIGRSDSGCDRGRRIESLREQRLAI